MADYIDRQAALRAVNEFFHDPKVDVALYDVPASNVREDVQGEWVLENTREKSYMRVCSVCKRISYCCTPVFSYGFCPNCGARMVGGGER